MPSLQSVLVAITMDDGELSVMRFLTQGRGNELPVGAAWTGPGQWSREPVESTLKFEIEKTFQGAAHAPVSWKIVPEESIPTDRTYRGAWRLSGNAITHDMERAKALHRELVRKVREPMLAELDRRWMRANGQGEAADAEAIEVRRQELRDATSNPAIDRARTVDELKFLLLSI